MVNGLFDFWARFALKRNIKILAEIAAMTDEEFVDRMSQIKARTGNVHVRAVCGQRWSKITFPKDHYLRKEQEAWHEWGQLAVS